MTPKERAAMQQALEALQKAEMVYAVRDVHPMAVKQVEEAITALREALAETVKQAISEEAFNWIDANAPMFVREALAEPKCWCETCRPITMDDMRMVLCPTCGNKRCPHATDHRNACTGSNKPGQKGSSYEHCKPAEQAEQEPVAIGSEWKPCMKLPVVVHVREQREGESHVSTREGITPVRPDDLIMRGVAGEEYPIGRELFNKTYTFDTAAPVQQTEQEPEVWYCPDCGTLSETQVKCCPDWIRSRKVPKNFALTCKATFDRNVQAEQEPVAWMWACTECGTEAEDGTDCRICSSCGYHKFYKAPKVATCVCAARAQADHIADADNMVREPVDTLRGFSLWLDREAWGHVIDGLMLERERSEQRKAANPESNSNHIANRCAELIAQIGQVAAAPVEPVKQEPVAYRIPSAAIGKFHYTETLNGEEDRFKKDWQPLYAHPVRTKDLTDEEIWEIWLAQVVSAQGVKLFARAVIAKDRELNK